MRNFKKFLALVLAMLMVSACAVSVSAAYADQAAINATGYAKAVSILSDLGVFAGKGDNTFDPNGTLTRAEAAVIASKLDTGAAGQKIDWTSSTCSFTDVDAAWSYAYINYASQHGIMDGVGGGKFNPNGTLTVAEAIVLAVKAAGLRADVAKLDEISKPSFWATNWIAVAGGANEDKIDLTANVTVFDYTAPCSRATMAQIAFNIFNEVKEIKDGFNMVEVSALVENVGDTKVEIFATFEDGTTKTLTVDRAAFEAAMAASGTEGNAETVKGATITMTYSKDNGVVYGVTLNSATLAFNYADGKLANVKENNANTVYVTLDGQKYIVADKNEVNDGTIGATSVVKAISINKILNYRQLVEVKDENDVIVESYYITEQALAPKESIPAFYDAVAYDDNSDGYYDRVDLSIYNVGTLKANTKDAKTIDNVKYTFDTIYDLAGNAKFTNYSDNNKEVFAINYVGETFEYGEVPVLYNVTFNEGTKKWDVDILEVAELVSGKLTAISNASSYVTVDGTKYSYAAEKVIPDNWTLNQTISMYTIGDKYVKFAGASKTTKTVIVNNVTVNENGAAVVTGYDVTNGYAEVELTVVGAYEGSLLRAKTAHDIGNAANTDAKKYAGKVALGTYDANAAKWTDYVTFEEGGYYDFYVTADGVYAASKTASKNVQALDSAVYGTFEVKGGYVYINGVAQYYTDGVVILEGVQAAADNYNAYADAYNKYTAYNKRANVEVAMLDTDGDNKIEFIYVGNSSDLASYAEAIEADQTIIQITSAAAVEAGFDYSVYNAIDLMTGAETTVKSTIGVSAGAFYVAKDGAIVEPASGLWVKNNEINVEYPVNGLIGSIKADTTKLEIYKGTKKAVLNKEDVLFGVDTITIYKANADGIIVDADDNGAADTLKIEDELLKGATATFNYMSYVVGGKMIVIINK